MNEVRELLANIAPFRPLLDRLVIVNLRLTTPPAFFDLSSLLGLCGFLRWSRRSCWLQRIVVFCRAGIGFTRARIHSRCNHVQ
jgi:hypothetical protein